MSLVDKLTKVDELRAELNALRPLPKETEQRVMQKLRLEWNYHSAKIEGGELTFGETKALLLFGITAAQKPLKDHLEMKGHNEAINFLIEFARDEQPLTESMIRELHRLILGREPFRAEAETADGQRTSRTITPGRYKQESNHVLTRTGEMFYFASPEETGAEMQKLVEWYREEHEKGETHPVLLAAEFHYRFVRIHPFDDGNGRMARLLMNLILMQHGLPPAVIQSDREHKEQYYRVLQAADAGDIEPFVEYVAREVGRSLDIMVRAAKGESIDDPDDVYKEIALLQKMLENSDEHKVEVERSPEVIQRVCRSVVAPLFDRVAGELSNLDKFCLKKQIVVGFDGQGSSVIQAKENPLDKASYIMLVQTTTDVHPADFYERLGSSEVSTTLFQMWEHYEWQSRENEAYLFYKWEGFKYRSDEANLSVRVGVYFERYRFSIRCTIQDKTLEFRLVKLYNNILLSEDEKNEIARTVLRSALEAMKPYLSAAQEGRK